jgi:hypothetical protein
MLFIGVWMTYALAFFSPDSGGVKVENWLFNDLNPHPDYPLGESPPKRNSGSPMKNSNGQKHYWISDLTPYFLRSRPSENQGGFGAKPGFLVSLVGEPRAKARLVTDLMLSRWYS